MIHGLVWTTIVDMNLSVSVLNSCHGVADLSKCVKYCVVVQSRTELRAQHIQNWVGDRGVVLPHSIRNSSPPPIRIPLPLFLENKVMWCRCDERLKNKAEGSKDRDEVNRREVCECVQPTSSHWVVFKFDTLFKAVISRSIIHWLSQTMPSP